MTELLNFLGWQDFKPWQILLLFSPLLLSFWSIWHVFFHKFPGKHEKLIWAYVTTFLPVAGGLVYIIFGRRRSKKI